MGIQVEFNPDLALRDIAEHEEGKRKIEECVPENLEVGKIYTFLKSGQRIFWLNESEFWGKGQVPLCKTNGKEELSRPIASIKILEVTHFLEDKKIWTKGKYEVLEVFKDDKIHFEACKKI
jgi:hypothetical protein